MNRAILSGDSVVLAGDFNAKLGKEHIPGDIHNISQNGRLLLNTLKTYDLVVLNSLRCCKGVFTRIKNTNADEKSVLDYVFTTNDLSNLVKDITIDEEKINTPWHSLRNGKKYSDHSAISVKMSFPKSDYRSEKPSKTTVWNFNDQQGWEKFQQITQHDLALANCCRVMLVVRKVIKSGKEVKWSNAQVF